VDLTIVCAPLVVIPRKGIFPSLSLPPSTARHGKCDCGRLCFSTGLGRGTGGLGTRDERFIPFRGCRVRGGGGMVGTARKWVDGGATDGCGARRW
jgi:hypothetical protein